MGHTENADNQSRYHAEKERYQKVAIDAAPGCGDPTLPEFRDQSWAKCLDGIEQLFINSCDECDRSAGNAGNYFGDPNSHTFERQLYFFNHGCKCTRFGFTIGKV